MNEIYILGNGAIAMAMAYGLKDKYKTVLVCRTENTMRKILEFGFEAELYGESYDINGKNVILAFKPYALNDVKKILSGNAIILISVMAFVSLAELRTINAKCYVRAMPNIAAEFKRSITPFSCVFNNNQYFEMTKQILDTFGTTCYFNDEKFIDIAMGISGCSPAYLAIVAESLTNACVLNGINKSDGTKLVSGAFESIASLLKHYHPAIIKDSICSPGGATIAGVSTIERSGVRGVFIDAINTGIEKVKNRS